MNLIIRRARKEDSSKIIGAHRRSIREVCSRDYSPEQITVWSGHDFQEVRWHQTIDLDTVWVVADAADNIFGFGHLQIQEDKAELRGLYFVPEAIGLGFGKQMVSLMLKECKSRAVQSVSLTGTKTAKKFYEAVGFEQVGSMKEVPIGGKPIEVFAMRLRMN
jgi:putative acetyltransferase